MQAYDKLFVAEAMENLSYAFDYAINDKGIDPDQFAQMFVVSGLADEFGAGNPKYVLGMSGQDLADRIIQKANLKHSLAVKRSRDKTKCRTPEYWAGWICAYWQWRTGRSFKEIFDREPLSHIIRHYHPYHEASEDKFVADMEAMIAENILETKLSLIRHNAGMSQGKLAEVSGVNIRNIQQYEQRKKDINKAEASTVHKLATALGCHMEDLLE